LISETINNEDDWITDMRMIEEIIGHSRDPEFVSKFMAVKLDNKRAL
jgi:hypothetical protein